MKEHKSLLVKFRRLCGQTVVVNSSNLNQKLAKTARHFRPGQIQLFYGYLLAVKLPFKYVRWSIRTAIFYKNLRWVLQVYTIIYLYLIMTVPIVTTKQNLSLQLFFAGVYKQRMINLRERQDSRSA